MAYVPPLSEQRSLIDHLIGLDRLQAFQPALDEQTLSAIMAAIADFAAQRIEPLAVPADRQGARWTPDGVLTPDGYRSAYRAFQEGGWMSIAAPAAAGGQEMPLILVAVLMETLCSAEMAFSLCPMLSFGAIDLLEAHGTPDQKRMWLPRLVSGEWTGTMNLTEPQAGSDVGALRTLAVRQADGRYSIKGQKIFITFGDHDLTDNIVHMVLARTPGAPAGTKGISLFLVPKFHLDARGEPAERNDVQCVSIERKLGIHGSPTCVMQFGENERCFGEIIGEEGDGLAAMFTMMNVARLQVGLQGVAVAEAATQLATRHALERIQSPLAGAASKESVAIIRHPDVRRMLLRMKALTLGARALLYHAFDLADQARRGVPGAQARLDILTPLAKAWSTDIGCEVASLGIQVHGGMGFIEETGAARFYRDARIAPIYEGTNGIQAADLVNRKLRLAGGAAMSDFIADLRARATQEAPLHMLLDAIERIVERLQEEAIEDALAGSYPLLTMLSVATAASLLAGSSIRCRADDATAMTQSATRYFLEVVVAEALASEAAARFRAGRIDS
jgi:alkylation response protein AidB-like acyl-CoA dehydrogenase